MIILRFPVFFGSDLISPNSKPKSYEFLTKPGFFERKGIFANRAPIFHEISRFPGKKQRISRSSLYLELLSERLIQWELSLSLPSDRLRQLGLRLSRAALRLELPKLRPIPTTSIL